MNSTLAAMRPWIDRFLAVGGILVIFLQVLFIVLEGAATEASPEFARMRFQFGVVLAGIIVNQIGVWSLANRVLPDRRVYLQLRGEVDRFIELVRTLNTYKVAGETERVDQTREKMIESLNRMVTSAGVTEIEE